MFLIIFNNIILLKNLIIIFKNRLLIIMKYELYNVDQYQSAINDSVFLLALM